MRILKDTIIFLFFILLLSCSPFTLGHDNFMQELPVHVPMQRTFIKNTLSYTIYVQATFIALTNKANISGSLLISTKTTPYTDIVEVEPGKIKQIMDYVEPNGIMIFVKEDGKLKNIYSNLNDDFLLGIPSFNIIYGSNIDTPYKTYTKLSSSMSDEDLAKIEPLDEEKYKVENLPWDTFSLGKTYVFEDGSVVGRRGGTIFINSLENRKKSLTDTKVYDYFIHPNPKADVFKR